MDNQLAIPAQAQPDEAPSMQGALQVYVQEAKLAMDAVRELQANVLRKDVDYGVIPGTGSKPTLLKSGAETLLAAFRFAVGDIAVDVVDMGAGHREYRVHTTITNRTDGRTVGKGEGSCSTLESKYRWRKGERVCPLCGAAAIKRSKYEDQDWYCYNKIGGCGAKFKADDKSITGQDTNRVENPDIADAYNTCLKMAKKRSLIDAALTTCAASGVFTQDIEDFADTEHDAPAPPKEPQRQQREMKLDKQPEPEKPASELAEYFVLKVEEKTSKKSGDPYAVVTLQLGDNPPFNALYFNSKLNGYFGKIRAQVGSMKDGKPLLEHAEYIVADADWTAMDELGPPLDMDGAQTLMDMPADGLSKGD